MPIPVFETLIPKSKKKAKKMDKLLEKLKKTDPILIQVKREVTELRKEETRIKGQMRLTTKSLESKWTQLMIKRNKRLKILGFKTKCIWRTKKEIKFLGF